MSGLANKFLIVSAGSIGKRHANNIKCLYPDAKITFLHLRQRPYANRTDEPNGFHHVYDSQEAIADTPDVAVICSPSTTHVALAMCLCSAGIPLFIEKPISDNLNDLGKLIACAEQYKIPISTGYHLRYEPCFVALQKLIRSRALGEIQHVHAEVGQYLPHWRPHMDYQNSVSAQKALGGGALLELSHEIDYVCALFGAPDYIAAQGGKLSELAIDVEDCVDLSFTYNNTNTLIHVHLDFLQHAASRYCKIIGSTGMIYWDLIDRELWHYQLDTLQWKACEVVPLDPKSDAYKEELSDFLSRLDDGRQMKVPLSDAQNVLEVIETARQNLAAKKTQRVILS